MISAVTRHEVVILLLWLGAGLEMLGLGLVAADLRRLGKRSAELSRRDQLVQVERIAHERSIAAPLVSATSAQPAREPTLEERVGKVEGRIEQVAASVKALEDRVHADIRTLSEQAAKWVAESRRETFDTGQANRGLLGEELRAHLWMRWIGVAFFLAGLVVNTLGNVWSI